MSELAVQRITRVLAQHYTDGSCDTECADICDCFGREPDYAKRAARAVLEELRAPLTDALNRLDAGGYQPGRTVNAQQLLRGDALASALLHELGIGDE